MALTITAAQVRARLGLESGEFSDADAATAAFIPAADAWATLVLDLNDTDEDSLSADQTAMMKAAKIAYTAIRVIKRKADDFKVGPIQIKNANLKELADELWDEVLDIMALLDFVHYEVYHTAQGGEDYIDDNINSTDSSSIVI